MSTVARVAAEINMRDNISRPLDAAGKKIDAFAAQADASLRRMAERSRKAWKDFGDELGRVSSKLTTTGLALTAGLTLPIGGFVKASVDAAAKMESMRASMTAITGSSMVAGAQLAELEKMAARTATSYDLLVRASMGMVTGFDGNVKASNAVLERFAKLANVLNVSKTDFERLVINLTQISGASRLTGDELREMASIMPNLRSLLKAAFGTSASEELAKFGITGRQALEGIARQIDAKGFKANTDTYNAQLQQMNTELFKLKVVSGEVFLPLARSVVTMAIPAMLKLSEAIRKLTPEQKRLAVTLLGAAAAAGPLLLVVGGLGNALSGMIAGVGSLSKLWGLLTTALAKSGGVLGFVRAAFALLTGPIGLIVAAATALYLAWKNNLLGIQDIMMPFVRRIGDMLSDLWANIVDTYNTIWPVLRAGWEGFVRWMKPALDAYKRLFQHRLGQILTVFQAWYQMITDGANVAMGLLQMIFGRGFDDLTNSVKAALMRMHSIATSVLTAIAEFAVVAFHAMFSWVALIPGIDDAYAGALLFARQQIDALREQGKAADFLAERYGKLAEADRKRRAVALSGPIGKRGLGGSAAPLNPFAPGVSVEKEGKAKKDKETKEERLRKQILADIVDLQRELAAEKLKAAGASLKDVLSMREYGKVYDKLLTSYRKAKIDAMAALEVFRMELAERERLAQFEAEQLKARTSARLTLNQSVVDAAAALLREREQLSFVTEGERVRWDITKGGYRAASEFAKALILMQARLLDQARAAKQAAEIFRDAWDAMIQKYGEWVREQRSGATARYEEYVKRLTEEMLELAGAQEKVIRADLLEQFKGLGAGMRDPAEAARVVAAKVEDIMGRMKQLADMKERIRQIREVADAINEVWKKSLDDLFENGFRGFFSSVLQGFRDLGRQIAAEFLRIQLMKALLWGVGQLFGGGARADLASGLRARADGGPVDRNRAYLVGERGPELFVPQGGGTIVPTRETAQMLPALAGAGGTHITINVSTPNPGAFRRSESQITALAFARAARARARNGGR